MILTAEQHHALYNALLRTIREFVTSPEMTQGPYTLEILAGDVTAAAANWIADGMPYVDYPALAGIGKEE